MKRILRHIQYGSKVIWEKYKGLLFVNLLVLSLLNACIFIPAPQNEYDIYTTENRDGKEWVIYEKNGELFIDTYEPSDIVNNKFIKPNYGIKSMLWTFFGMSFLFCAGLWSDVKNHSSLINQILIKFVQTEHRDGQYTYIIDDYILFENQGQVPRYQLLDEIEKWRAEPSLYPKSVRHRRDTVLKELLGNKN